MSATIVSGNRTVRLFMTNRNTLMADLQDKAQITKAKLSAWSQVAALGTALNRGPTSGPISQSIFLARQQTLEVFGTFVFVCVNPFSQ
jgi:hypothetical protein